MPYVTKHLSLQVIGSLDIEMIDGKRPERVRCNFHDRSAIAISGFAPSRACKRKVRIGIRICVGIVECIPVGTSKRSARQRTPGVRRVDFPRGFGSETDLAGVGAMKTNAVLHED